jgi:hypothetical protein
VTNDQCWLVPVVMIVVPVHHIQFGGVNSLTADKQQLTGLVLVLLVLVLALLTYITSAGTVVQVLVLVLVLNS